MKIKLILLFLCFGVSLSAQNFSKTSGFSYGHGATSSINSNEWGNLQDFFVNEFAFTAQRKVKNNLYLTTALRGGDRKGHFRNSFTTNAIAKDSYLEVPIGLRSYVPLSPDKLFLSVGLDVSAGVSLRQERYFDFNTSVPDLYENVVWLSNVNLGLSGEVSLCYPISEKIWISGGIMGAWDLANFSRKENYEAVKSNRRFFNIGLIYIKE